MENPLKNLKIKNYYSYLLVLGGFILIASLFYEPKIIPQGKLILLSVITIVYGLVEWIRETNHINFATRLNQEFLAEWEAASGKKTLEQINDSSWDYNFRKDFLKKYKAENLVRSYVTKTWIFLIIYLIVMVLIYLI